VTESFHTGDQRVLAEVTGMVVAEIRDVDAGLVHRLEAPRTSERELLVLRETTGARRTLEVHDREVVVREQLADA
jgi:hypothetical protein